MDDYDIKDSCIDEGRAVTSSDTANNSRMSGAQHLSTSIEPPQAPPVELSVQPPPLPQHKRFHRRKNFCPKISNNDEAFEDDERGQTNTDDNGAVDVVNIDNGYSNGPHPSGLQSTTAMITNAASAHVPLFSHIPAVIDTISSPTTTETTTMLPANRLFASLLSATPSSAAELLLQQQHQQQQRALWLQALLLQNSLVAAGQSSESVGNENYALLALSRQLAALQQQQQAINLPATTFTSSEDATDNNSDSTQQPALKKQKPDFMDAISLPTSVSSLNQQLSRTAVGSQSVDVMTSSSILDDEKSTAGSIVANKTISHGSTSPLSHRNMLQQSGVQGCDDESSTTVRFINTTTGDISAAGRTAEANDDNTPSAVSNNKDTNSSAEDEDESNMLFIDDDDEYGEEADIVSNSNSGGGNAAGGASGEKQWQGVRQSVRYLDVWKYVYRCRGKHNDENCGDFAALAAVEQTPGSSGREHFHCLFCKDKLMHRKEEMIRHVKNHKKRDETLQLGFMRYTNAENCALKFPNQNCQFREKQTHYHCLGSFCTKIYTSTSDVQMHATLHKKEQQMQREGFQRFKATGGARCDKPGCPYKDEKVTHFHCIREGCQLDAFGFKNKADLTKHKAYHDKNDQLQKQGFIKYMKHDHCPFEKCPYSKVFNHIHCLRPGCQEVFTSAAQTTTHKRKHERGGVTGGESTTGSSSSNGNTLDNEMLMADQQPTTYSRRLKPGAASMVESELTAKLTPGGASASAICAVQSLLCRRLLQQQQQKDNDDILHTVSKNKKSSTSSVTSLSLPPSSMAALAVTQRSTSMTTSPTLLSTEVKVVRSGSSSSQNQLALSVLPALSNKVSRRKRKQASSTDVESAVHTQDESVVAGPDEASCSMDINTSNTTTNNKRKRGRPPKSVAITINKRPHMPPNANPQAIFTNFKLGKGGRLVNMKSEPAAYSDGKPVHVTATSAAATFAAGPATTPAANSSVENLVNVVRNFGDNGDGERAEKSSASTENLRNTAPASSSSVISPPNSGSPTALAAVSHQAEFSSQLALTVACRYGKRCRLSVWQRPHYHCSHSRCHFGTDNIDILVCHIQQFHAEGNDLLSLPTYEYFDSQIECEYSDCQSKGLARHFHCTRAGCGGFSFVRHSTMQSHEERHAPHALVGSKSLSTISPPRVTHATNVVADQQQQQSTTAVLSSWPNTTNVGKSSSDTNTTASTLAALATLFQQQQQQNGNRPFNFSAPTAEDFNSSLYNALAGAILTPPSPVVPVSTHQSSASHTLLLDALLKLIRNPLISSDSSKLTALLNLYKVATTNTFSVAPPGSNNTGYDAVLSSLLHATQQQANSAAAAQILSLSQNSTFSSWPQSTSSQPSPLNLLFPSQSLSPSDSLNTMLARLTQSSSAAAVTPTSFANFSLLNSNTYHQSMLPNPNNNSHHLPSGVDGSNALASMLALVNGQPSSHQFYTANNSVSSATSAEFNVTDKTGSGARDVSDAPSTQQNNY